jgi:hypothetical protein
MTTRNRESGTPRHTPEAGGEVLSVQEKLKKDLLPAIDKLRQLQNTVTGTEREQILHTLISMESAIANLEKTGPNVGKQKIVVEGYNGRPGYTHYESVPMDEAIKILKQAEATLPSASPEKKQYQTIIAKLEKTSVGYYDAHFNKPSADVVSGRTPLTPEEADIQDLRVRHEGKLISNDHRRSTNPDPAERLREDYKTGQKALDQRREWKYSPIELPTTIAVVEASHSAEVMARMRTDAEMNKRMNQGSFLGKWWNKVFEEGKKRELYEEELRKISGKPKKQNWFSRTILRRKDEAPDKANLFRDTDASGAENEAEMSALAKRFTEDNIRKSEGEQRKQLTDPKFNDRINELVHEYATGHMTDAEFSDRKDTLVAEIQKKYPSTFKEGILTADNFLESARVFRKYHEHGGKLARTDMNLQVVLGEAKSRIKSEANLTWAEGVLNKVNQNAIGQYVKPATVGYAISAFGYFIKKPLYGLLGATGLGGLMGIIRRGKQVKQDIAMHRAEREAGIEVNVDKNTAKRRAKVEEFVTNMEKASYIIAEVQSLRVAYEQNPTPENRSKLVQSLANAEARITLSAQRQRGLIQYEGETSFERSAMTLMAEVAQGKIIAGVSDISKTAEYKNVIKELTKDVNKKDSEAERFKRWEMLKAGMLGTVTGFVFGGVAQEVTDEMGEELIARFGHNNLWDWMDRPQGGTSVEKLQAYVMNHRSGPKANQNWWDWLKDSYAGCEGGGHLGEARDVSGMPVHSLKLDKSLDIVPDKCNAGMFAIKDHASGHVIQEVMINNGQITPVGGKWVAELAVKDSSIILPGSGAGAGTRVVDSLEFLKQNGGTEMHRRLWYDQDTPKVFDENELELKFGGIGGKGFDKDGNLIIDISSLKDNASRHDGKILDIVKTFKDGHFKIALTPDGGHQSNVKLLDVVVENGKIIAKIPKGDPMLEQLFTAGAGRGGQADYHGRFMEIVNVTGTRADGSVDAEVVATFEGAGKTQFSTASDLGGAKDGKSGFDYVIQRKFNDAQCVPEGWDPPMFVPLYRRKPLEMRNSATAEQSASGAGDFQEGAGHTPEDGSHTSNEPRPVTTETQGGTQGVLSTNTETGGSDSGDGDDGEVLPTKPVSRELQARQQENINKVQGVISEFNRSEGNKNPHIRLEVDRHLMATKPDEVQDMIVRLQLKLEDAMEALKHDRNYRNRNFVFRFKNSESLAPEVTENDTEVLNFSLNQEVGEIVPIFRRYLEGGLQKTKEAAGKTQAVRTQTNAQSNREAPVETDAQKRDKIFEELINANEHRFHMEGSGTLMSESEQYKVIGEFKKAWDQLSQGVKNTLKNRVNAKNTGPLNKGIIFNLTAGATDISFDPATDFLRIPPNKTAAEIKAFLENSAGGPPAGGRGGNQNNPPRGGGH